GVSCDSSVMYCCASAGVIRAEAWQYSLTHARARSIVGLFQILSRSASIVGVSLALGVAPGITGSSDCGPPGWLLATATNPKTMTTDASELVVRQFMVQSPTSEG